MSLKMIFFWLVVGNVAYQVFGAQNWHEAFDHSYFQGIALLSVWVISIIRPVSLHHR